MNRNTIYKPKFVHKFFFALVLSALVLASWQLFFKQSLPTADNLLIIEHYQGEVHRASSFLSKPESIPFRLYGNGLLICGQDKHGPQTSTVLSRTAIAELINNIKSTGFTKLNAVYAVNEYRIAEDLDTILLNDGQTQKQVNHYSGAKPQAYTRTQQLLENTCRQVTSPYIPSTLTVKARRVSSALHDLSNLGTWAANIPFPDNEDGARTYSGSDAKAVIDSFGKHTHGYFTHQGALYEAAYYPDLPDYTTEAAPATIRLNQARAASHRQVKFIWWVAKDTIVAPEADQRDQIATSIRSWFAGQVGKSYKVEPTELVIGQKKIAEYRTCNQVEGCKSQLHAIYDNIYKEYTARYGEAPFSSGKSINILMQFNSDGKGGCEGLGGANIQPPESNQIKDTRGGFAIVADINGKVQEKGIGCQVEEYKFEYPAHELGHTFGLDHRFKTQTIMDYYNCAWPSGCKLDKWQGQALYHTSPYFNLPSAAPAPASGPLNPPPTIPPPGPNDVVGIAYNPAPATYKYWKVKANGSVDNGGGLYNSSSRQGSTTHHGDASQLSLKAPIVGIAANPRGYGYWLVASDGGIFAFGSAKFYGSLGSLKLNQPVVGMAPTDSGNGYWLVAADGGVFAFGDAKFKGSTGGIKLNQPVVGIAARPGLVGNQGYWLVKADGGVFAFGTAPYKGSTSKLSLKGPVVGIATVKLGGYWLVGADGGVFAFGDAGFFGSQAIAGVDSPIRGMAINNVDQEYCLVSSMGTTYCFRPPPGYQL